MSGPKVVRLVTRDELVSICEGHLARLGAAVDEWIKVGRRNDTVTDAEITATLARQEEFRRMLARDRFNDLQKAVPAEISFLSADREARLARAASAKAEARSVRRQTEAAAASVLAALGRKGVQVPDGLRVALEDVASGRSGDAAAISRAFALLSDKQETAVSDHQRRLADALKGADERQGFNEWMAGQSKNKDDEVFTRLNQRIAELSVILGEAAAAEFENRLRRLFSGEPPSALSLMIDSLEVDLAKAVSKAKERAALQSRLRMLAAELSQLGSENCEALARSITERLGGTSEVLVELEKEATLTIGRLREEEAAKSRRQALLKGLADLGYQVAEDMETAWVRDGKVVIKRAAQPEYGVEVGGKVESGRVQMRTVAIRNPDTPVDATGDRDAETIFCSHVSRLEEKFAEVGGAIVIERALPVGATPLRVIADAAETEDKGIQERSPRQLRLK